MVVALAALASVGFAGFRIATAVGNAGSRDGGSSGLLSPTTAERARTLAHLHALSGFHEESCRKLKQRSTPAPVCYFDSHSISIDDGWMRRALTEMGLELWPSWNLGDCSHTASFRVPGLRFRSCVARGHLGREEVTLSAESLRVPRRAAHSEQVRKVERYWVTGTVLTVEDGGHT